MSVGMGVSHVFAIRDMLKMNEMSWLLSIIKEGVP